MNCIPEANTGKGGCSSGGSLKASISGFWMFVYLGNGPGEADKGDADQRFDKVVVRYREGAEVRVVQ